MLKDIVSAQPIAPYQIHLRFEDGIEGTIDLSKLDFIHLLSGFRM